MIIVEKPFVSEPLITWMEQTQHPVLNNDMAQELVAQGHNLALCDDETAARRIAAGERTYTDSENALGWIFDHVDNQELLDAISVFKDKHETRVRLAELDPTLYYRTVTFDEVQNLDYTHLPERFVIKPSTGFGSMGVYMVESAEGLADAKNHIAKDYTIWLERYPKAVIQAGEFIIEEYIEGQEYALEAYFDEEGAVHLLNVLRHDFSDDTDMSDRLYVTSPAMMEEMREQFISWLEDVNRILRVKNVAVHPEVRLNETGIHVIEFNPMRFMGMGGTDISWYAYGIRSFEVFLENKHLDWEQIYAENKERTFATMILNPPADTPETAVFDYAALDAKLPTILSPRRFSYPATGLFGFYILDITNATDEQRDFMLHSDLSEFIS